MLSDPTVFRIHNSRMIGRHNFDRTKTKHKQNKRKHKTGLYFIIYYIIDMHFGDWRHDKYYSKRVESVNSDRSNLNFSVENRLFFNY